MAMTTTRINGVTSANNYGFYANVLIWDNIEYVVINGVNTATFKVMVNAYLVNNGVRTNSSGWTINARIDGVGSETLTNQTINTTTVDRYGGEVLCISKTFQVPITFGTMFVAGYLTKSSYTQYDPGASSFDATLQLPKVQSTWNTSLISIPNIASSFTLPISKYVSNYYNVVEVRNSNNTILVKTINDANNGDSVSFTSNELNTIYSMDNNASAYPLIFYMDLKTYTDSTKATQIGTAQRVKCEAYLVGSEPTAIATLVEQDANVISLLGSSTSTKIIKNASDLLFTITATAYNGASISSVKVNNDYATYDSDSGKYILNLTNLTTGTFYILVTDSRGLTQTTALTKTLLDYIAVNIHYNWEVERASQVSSDLVLNAIIDCYSSTIDGNTNTPTIQYSTDNENWSNISSSSYTFNDDKITITNLTLSNLISYQDTGTFYLKATDLLSSHQDNRQITKGIETFSYSEDDMQINGDLFIADIEGNNVVNVGNGIIVEKGTGYIKFGNGIMICYGKQTITTAINSSWGSLYGSPLQTLDNYGAAFTTIYSCNFDTLLGATNWIGTGETGTNLPLTRPPKIYLLSGAAQSSNDYVVGYTAIGTWK